MFCVSSVSVLVESQVNNVAVEYISNAISWAKVETANGTRTVFEIVKSKVKLRKKRSTFVSLTM